jgi:perosamine synthetase
MIPVCVPHVGHREQSLLADCIQTGWISSEGPYVSRFEEEVASSCGKRYGIAVSSGTAALDVAIGCLGLKAGDEVIIPTFTIISCAQAVVRHAGVPVLVDSEPDTWCMDVSQVEEKIGPRTRAIMAVHIYGHPVDMDPLRELADQHALAIIEDTAEAQGGRYKGRPCGGLGDISCFSFYANKLITTGEGGMLLTDDAAYADRARAFRNLCFRPEKRFLHLELGNNYRMTNLQAAVGVAQMEGLSEKVESKRRMGRAYAERLSKLPGLQLPVEREWASNVYWMYGIVLSEELGIEATEFATRLGRLGIDTRPFFLGMHEQPALLSLGLFNDQRYPVAERLARQGLYLPSSIGLTDEEINQVCAAVHEALI